MAELSGATEKRLLLVRHAVHGSLDRVLVGRMPGVSIGAEGRKQARALARRLAGEKVTAVHSSPRERARETAALIAEPHGLEVAIAPELDEVDFGAWAGSTFETLNGDRRWRAWNSMRSSARPPGGESMQELQARAIGYVEWLRRECQDGVAVLVTHAEVIRAALLHWLGRPLDEYASVEVAPASVTILAAGRSGIRIIATNQNWADESHDESFSG
jgi:broad specificity phosphatase PhoE